MGETLSLPVWMLLLPFIAAALAALLPARLARAVACLAMVGQLGLGVMLLRTFRDQPDLQGVASWPMLGIFGSTLRLGVDGLSVFLLVAGAALGLLAVLVSGAKRPPAFHAWLLLFVGTMAGVLVVQDLLVFYVFWELMLLPALVLILLWGDADRRKATVPFVVVTLVGSLAMLAVIFAMGAEAHARFGAWNFDLDALAGVVSTWSASARCWAFAGLVLAFAVKIPLFPLHYWLPAAYTSAPLPAVILLSGLMAKLGTYGVLRVAMPLFPEQAVAWAPWLAGLAVVGILHGAVLALGARDVRTVLAYSSFSHLGWIALGIFSLTAEGLGGAMLQQVGHALVTATLFILAAWASERQGATHLSRFGGMAATHPWLAAALVFAAMASAGLPGLNGFVGEFLILLGAWGLSPWVAFAGGLGVVLGAAYLLWLLQRMLYGPAVQPAPTGPDLGVRELAVVLPLLVMMVLFGVRPGLLIDRMKPWSDAYVLRFHKAVPQAALPTGAHP
ncbi:MAG: NADH-quinone oxidoreductase subunit M [Candidatus Sericytochromatia bacterium]|nr:NADH-quinone oxidoreductase subunit M [Candidatus Tanganyikabacteria bacterium]